MAAVTALFLVSPAYAAEAPAESRAAEPKQRLICRTTEQLGSRLRKSKSCRTAREWADIRNQTQDKMVEMQRVGSTSS
jgi:hypothetical protein